ncbi:hypothetical protein KFL_003080080 [Klebsormidium nitens]|uniref:Uncharacterized protein n=1 Tax=Klebsormidium nitens TaxID=105231 RepID=A0A1Y1IDE2_KLENI|nr:hypothetical protein KFL_003080080 [Klebsormidium nitens]|eukprot:GAQ86737.1 hypothetical protein KFL_003080080 [Klebsormidium nitens]
MEAVLKSGRLSGAGQLVLLQGYSQQRLRGVEDPSKHVKSKVCAAAGGPSVQKLLAESLRMAEGNVKVSLEMAQDAASRASEAEKKYAEANAQLKVSESSRREVINLLLDKQGRKDIRSAIEVASEVPALTNVTMFKGVRGPPAVIDTLLKDATDSLGFMSRITNVCSQAALRPQDIHDNLRDIYHRFASGMHGQEWPVVVINSAHISETNLRAALAILFDFAGIKYVYVDKGTVVHCPYKLPGDPLVTTDLGMTLEEIQLYLQDYQSATLTRDLTV